MSDTKVEVIFDDRRKGYVLEKHLTECPRCKKKSVRAKEWFEGGGVKCITEKCGYWFCY